MPDKKNNVPNILLQQDGKTKYFGNYPENVQYAEKQKELEQYNDENKKNVKENKSDDSKPLVTLDGYKDATTLEGAVKQSFPQAFKPLDLDYFKEKVRNTYGHGMTEEGVNANAQMEYNNYLEEQSDNYKFKSNVFAPNTKEYESLQSAQHAMLMDGYTMKAAGAKLGMMEKDYAEVDKILRTAGVDYDPMRGTYVRSSYGGFNTNIDKLKQAFSLKEPNTDAEEYVSHLGIPADKLANYRKIKDLNGYYVGTYNRLSNEIEKGMGEVNDIDMNIEKGVGKVASMYAIKAQSHGMNGIISDILTDASKTLDAPSKGGFGKSVGYAVFDADAWLMNTPSLAKNLVVVKPVFNKLERGETLSQDEIRLLHALNISAQASEFRQNNTSTGYRAGESFGESIPFFVSMGLTMGLTSTAIKKASQQFAKQVLKIQEKEAAAAVDMYLQGVERKIISNTTKNIEKKVAEEVEKQVAKGVERDVAETLVRRNITKQELAQFEKFSAGNAARGYVRKLPGEIVIGTPIQTVLAPSTYNNMFESMNGTVRAKDGKYFLDKTESDSLVDAFMSNYIETFTERATPEFTQFMGNVMSKSIKGWAGKKINQTIYILGRNKQLQELLKLGDYVQELGEEHFGNAIQFLYDYTTAKDEEEKQNAVSSFKEFYAPDQLGMLALSMIPMFIPTVAGNTTQYVRFKHNSNANAREIRSLLNGKLSKEEINNYMDKVFDMTPQEAFAYQAKISNKAGLTEKEASQLASASAKYITAESIVRCSDAVSPEDHDRAMIGVPQKVELQQTDGQIVVNVIDGIGETVHQKTFTDMETANAYKDLLAEKLLKDKETITQIRQLVSNNQQNVRDYVREVAQPEYDEDGNVIGHSLVECDVVDKDGNRMGAYLYATDESTNTATVSYIKDGKIVKKAVALETVQPRAGQDDFTRVDAISAVNNFVDNYSRQSINSAIESIDKAYEAQALAETTHVEDMHNHKVGDKINYNGDEVRIESITEADNGHKIATVLKADGITEEVDLNAIPTANTETFGSQFKFTQDVQSGKWVSEKINYERKEAARTAFPNATFEEHGGEGLNSYFRIILPKEANQEAPVVENAEEQVAEEAPAQEEPVAEEQVPDEADLARRAEIDDILSVDASMEKKGVSTFIQDQINATKQDIEANNEAIEKARTQSGGIKKVKKLLEEGDELERQLSILEDALAEKERTTQSNVQNQTAENASQQNGTTIPSAEEQTPASENEAQFEVPSQQPVSETDAIANNGQRLGVDYVSKVSAQQVMELSKTFAEHSNTPTLITDEERLEAEMRAKGESEETIAHVMQQVNIAQQNNYSVNGFQTQNCIYIVKNQTTIGIIGGYLDYLFNQGGNVESLYKMIDSQYSAEDAVEVKKAIETTIKGFFHERQHALNASKGLVSAFAKDEFADDMKRAIAKISGTDHYESDGINKLADEFISHAMQELLYGSMTIKEITGNKKLQRLLKNIYNEQQSESNISKQGCTFSYRSTKTGGRQDVGNEKSRTEEVGEQRIGAPIGSNENNENAGEPKGGNRVNASISRERENLGAATAEFVNAALKEAGFNVSVGNMVNFSVVKQSDAIPKRVSESQRRKDREAFKKAFKVGGERMYDMLHDREGGIMNSYPFEFLDYLKDRIGDKKNALAVAYVAHEQLANEFIDLHPEFFAHNQSDNKVDINKLLGTKGFMIERHTLDNGMAMKHVIMYRSKFEPTGKTDVNNVPSDGKYGGSVICYYKHPETNLDAEHVFTVTHQNALNIPTALELKNDQSTMTPEWEEYLIAKGYERNEDGTFNLDKLEAEHEDPFGSSHIMIRVNKSNGSVQIISRYNHETYDADGKIVKVKGNPNRTFNSKLDDFVEGLDSALFDTYDLQKLYYREDGLYTIDINGKLYFPLRRNAYEAYGLNFEILGGDVRIHENQILFGNTLFSETSETFYPNDGGSLQAHNSRYTNGGLEFSIGGWKEEIVKQVEQNGETKEIKKTVWEDDAKMFIQTKYEFPDDFDEYDTDELAIFFGEPKVYLTIYGEEADLETTFASQHIIKPTKFILPDIKDAILDKSNIDVVFPNATTIENLEDKPIMVYDGLYPKVEKMKGDFKIYRNTNLSNLKSVEGSITFMPGCRADNLETVTGELTITENAEIDFPNLKSVNGKPYSSNNVNFSVSDIKKLNYKWGDNEISLVAFADTFQQLIKQKDRTLEDVNRIAKGYIDAVYAKPEEFIPALLPENMTHARYFISKNGHIYNPNSVEFDSPEYNTQKQLYEIYRNILGYRMQRFLDLLSKRNELSKEEKSEFDAMEREVNSSDLMQRGLENNAQKITDNRRKDIKDLIDYFRSNNDYTESEKALIVKGALSFGVRETKTEEGTKYDIVKITDKNDIAVQVHGGEMTASIVGKLREGKDYKTAIIEVHKDNAKALTNERGVSSDFTGWKVYKKSATQEDAVELCNAVKGTGWCTGGSDSTAKMHRSGGDFHVYFVKGEPMIAIRTENGRMAEPPRGAHPGQFCTPEEEAIAEKYIREGNGITAGKDYLDDMNDIRKLADGTMTWKEALMMPPQRRYENGEFGGNTRAWSKSTLEAKDKIIADHNAERLEEGWLYQGEKGWEDSEVLISLENATPSNLKVKHIILNAIIREGVKVPNLESIGGNASIREGVKVPNLESIGGYANIGEGVEVPNLKSVNGKPYDVNFSIVGVKGAKRIDEAAHNNILLSSLETAMNMEESGVSAESIFLATGWKRGVENKWKHEIPDIELNDDKLLEQTDLKYVEDIVVGNKQLFEAYPDLRDVQVVENNDSFYLGLYDATANVIELNLGDLRNALLWDDNRARYLDELNKLKQVFLHEVQHYIQFQEGFAKGDNTTLSNKFMSDLAANYPAMFAFWNFVTTNESYDGNKAGLQETIDAINKTYNVTDKQSGTYVDRLLKLLNGMNENEFKSFYDSYVRLRDSYDANRNAIYHASAGEMESLEVEDRANMTQWQRERTPFGIYKEKNMQIDTMGYLPSIEQNVQKYANDYKLSKNAIIQFAKEKGITIPQSRMMFDQEQLENKNAELYDEYLNERELAHNATDTKTMLEHKAKADAINASISRNKEDLSKLEKKIMREIAKGDVVQAQKLSNKRMYGDGSNLLYTLFDVDINIKRMQEAIVAMGGTVTDDTNVYERINHYASRARHRIDKFMNDKNGQFYVLSQNVKDIVKFLSDNNLGNLGVNFTIEDVYGEKQEFPAKEFEVASLYIQALDIIEAESLGLAKRGAEGFEKAIGMTPKEYVDMVESTFKDKGQDVLLTNLVVNTRRATNAILDKQFEYGMITQDLYEHLLKREHYCPQRGWYDDKFNPYESDEDVSDLYPTSQKSNVMIKAKGRESLASNPIPYIANMYQNTIIAGEKNRYKQCLLALIEANEEKIDMSASFGIKRDIVLYKPIKVTNADGTVEDKYQQVTIPATYYKHHKSQFKSYSKRVQASDISGSVYLDDNGQQKTIASHNTLNDYRMYDNHSVKVFVGGVEHTISFANARMKSVLDRSFAKGYSNIPFISAMKRGTGLMSRLVTSLSAQFSPKNAFRDVQFQLATNFIEGNGVAVNARVLELQAALRPLLHKYYWKNNGEIDTSTEYGKYFKEFVENGAETGWAFSQSVDEISKKLNKMMKKRELDIPNFFFINQFMSECSETATRLAQYIVMRESGKSVFQSVIAAKEVSTNFDRKGLLSFYLSPFYTFFNATMQGTYKLGKMAARNRALFATVAGAFFIGGFMNTMEVPNDDDDEKYFSEYDRMTNFVFKIGDISWRIPLPHGLRTIWACGVQAALFMQGEKDGYTMTNQIMQASYDAVNFIGNDLFPINPVDVAVPFKMEYGQREHKEVVDFVGLTPSLFLPFAYMKFNRTFTGGKIHPESKFDDKYTVQWKNGAPDATSASIQFCKWVFENMAGGNKDAYSTIRNDTWYPIEDWFNMNPSNVDYLINQYRGGAGEIAVGIYRAIDLQDWTQAPFAKGFTKKYQPEKRVNAEAYKMYHEADIIKRHLQDYTDAYNDALKEYKNTKSLKSLDELQKNVQEKAQYIALEKAVQNAQEVAKIAYSGGTTITGEPITVKDMKDLRKMIHEAQLYIKNHPNAGNDIEITHLNDIIRTRYGIQ